MCHRRFTHTERSHASGPTFRPEMQSSLVCNYSKAPLAATVTGAALEISNNVYLEGRQLGTVLFLITEHIMTSLESYM